MPGFARATNRAGGTEGGMSTGEPLVVRVAMKPISTLMSPLKTVDLKTGGPAQAQSERSDVTAVPAMGVIAEAMLAIVLTEALLEKFGGGAVSQRQRNVDGHLRQERAPPPKGTAGAAGAAVREGTRLDTPGGGMAGRARCAGRCKTPGVPGVSEGGGGGWGRWSRAVGTPPRSNE